MNAFTQKNQLKYFRELRGLLETEAFQFVVSVRRQMLQVARERLEQLDPKDVVAISKSQEEIRVRKAELAEYDDIKNIIFKLESVLESGKPVTIESELIPPRG
jgi:hypothetical protein